MKPFFPFTEKVIRVIVTGGEQFIFRDREEVQVFRKRRRESVWESTKANQVKRGNKIFVDCQERRVKDVYSDIWPLDIGAIKSLGELGGLYPQNAI